MGHAEEFDGAISYLCEDLRTRLYRVSGDVKENTSEVRLRLGQAVLLTGRYGACRIPGTYITKEHLDYCFSEFCRHSVYSYEKELRRGFITLDGGHRVGISGRYLGGSMPTEIYSFCLRIAGKEELKDKTIIDEIRKDNRSVLIGGEPGSGKTTVLRSIAAALGKKTAVIDERMELCGGMLFDCDVFEGVEKRRGIEIATRCFSPENIVCDEISGCEAKSLYNAVFCGVRIIASAHITSPGDVLKKPFIKGLIVGGVFEKIIFLHGRDRPAEVERIITADEIIGNYGSLFGDNLGGCLFEEQTER